MYVYILNIGSFSEKEKIKRVQFFYFLSFRKTLKLLRGKDHNINSELEELKNVVQNEKKRSKEKSKLSLLRSRTFLLPALLISISFAIQVMSGVELCSYYVGFIFRDVGVRLEVAGIIIQVMLSTQEISRADPLLAVDCHSRIPADSSPSVEV